LRAGEYLSELYNGMLNVIYPPLCLICESDIDGPRLLCAHCLTGVERISGFHCDRCGAPAGATKDSCICHHLPDDLGVVRSSVQYSGAAREIVHFFKFGGYWGLATPIAEMMEEDVRSLAKEEDDSVVIGVPLHRIRQRERGYDQARLLARDLSARLGLDCIEDALKRCKNSKPQAQLSLKERVGNMSGAFKITNFSKIRGKTIFLVDDVITTGITLGSCATALIGAGAERVLAISFARRMLIEPVEGRSIHGD